jgi:septum formation protein
MEWLNKHKILLASQSPRRHELMRQAGIRFEIRAAEIDEENYPLSLKPQTVPEYLANLKARTVFESVPDKQDLIVIAADCLVFHASKIYSKPRDRDEAYLMLSQLAGHTHEVISGLCIYSGKNVLSTSVSTEVEFNPMTSEEIYYYIDHYPPYDKAGAYGIQDWIGLCVVNKINGSYTILSANFKE